MNLDARLSLACDLYDKCSLAADIGTDHAHLPIALLRSGKCRRMILSDISPDALLNARDNIARCRLTDRVDFRLGDGLTVLREPVPMISILGMGGRTIAEMLLRDRDCLRDATLLLSAHTDLPLVREALRDIGYRLDAEEPCFDAGRYYLVMKASPGAETLSPREIRLGKPLFSSRSDVLLPYLRKRREVLAAKLAGMRKASARDDGALAPLEEDLAYLNDCLKENTGRREQP